MNCLLFFRINNPVLVQNPSGVLYGNADLRMDFVPKRDLKQLETRAEGFAKLDIPQVFGKRIQFAATGMIPRKSRCR